MNWGGVQRPGHTFAVFNNGTPSYRVEDGVVLVSVQRSPILPSGLLQLQGYSAYNFGKMVHPGTHCFRHAQPILHVPPTYKTTHLTNLLEEPISPLELRDGKITIPMAPHKIAAVRLARDRKGHDEVFRCINRSSFAVRSLYAAPARRGTNAGLRRELSHRLSRSADADGCRAAYRFRYRSNTLPGFSGMVICNSCSCFPVMVFSGAGV